MSINALRHIGYVDDGVDEYECLNCYHPITTRNWIYNPTEKKLIWQYCPKCGTKWEQYIPEKERGYYRYDPKRLESVNLLSYRIQERMVFDGEPYKWENVSETFGFKDTASQLKWYRDREQKKYKEDDLDCKLEYRFILKDEDNKQLVRRHV